MLRLNYGSPLLYGTYIGREQKNMVYLKAQYNKLYLKKK